MDLDPQRELRHLYVVFANTWMALNKLIPLSRVVNNILQD